MKDVPMALFYNEAEVRIEGKFAEIDFGAYPNKGSHVKNKVNGYVR